MITFSFKSDFYQKVVVCFLFLLLGVYISRNYDEKVSTFKSYISTLFLLDKKAVDFSYQTIDVNSMINIKDIRSSDSIRKLAVKLIFGTDQLPMTLPIMGTDTLDEDFLFIKNLKKIQIFKVPLANNLSSRGYFFSPKVVSNNKIIIYHEGHGKGLLNGKKIISNFLDRGCIVVGLCMPLMGLNSNKYIVHDTKIGNILLHSDHEDFKYLDNPLSYFIEPVIAVNNYIRSLYPDKEINIIGFSGGGWTAVLSASIDTRIQKSVSIAGSYPLYIRLYNKETSGGDFEQIYPPLYKSVTYLDLYILMSLGDGRKSIHIYNEFDDCCFNGRHFEHYEYILKDILLKYNGSFDVLLDTKNRRHSLSDWALSKLNEIL